MNKEPGGKKRMIFGNVRNLKEYFFLEDGVFECFRYAKEHDLCGYDRGSHEIDGKRLFFNMIECETVEAEKRFWEAHRDYLDIHLMVEGRKQIDLNFVHNMDVKEYVKEEDFLSMEGPKNGSVILEEGDFLICYPSDAHRTAVAVDKTQKIRKAVFKVRI